MITMLCSFSQTTHSLSPTAFGVSAKIHHWPRGSRHRRDATSKGALGTTGRHASRSSLPTTFMPPSDLSPRERWLLTNVSGSVMLDIGFAGQKGVLPGYFPLVRLKRPGVRLFGLDWNQ